MNGNRKRIYKKFIFLNWHINLNRIISGTWCNESFFAKFYKMIFFILSLLTTIHLYHPITSLNESLTILIMKQILNSDENLSNWIQQPREISTGSSWMGNLLISHIYSFHTLFILVENDILSYTTYCCIRMN